jgi:perosamine synthetase
MKYISKLISAISIFIFHKHFQGFVQGHTDLKKKEWSRLSDLLDHPEEKYTQKFEKAFALVIGEGECVSFAAGRMAFYALLKHLCIGEGDDVILTGFTCSVMVNALIRTGANIIYCDIDQETFGTSTSSVKSCISDKTKMIIAQHSFGIPCDIVKLSKLSKEKEIFLLEDCAIALGSSINNTAIGNFGDAAIFSTDHSKPINTFSGGLLYSNNQNLTEKIKQERGKIAELPKEKTQAILKRIKFESKYCNSRHYHKLPLLDVIETLVRRMRGRSYVSPYLDEDQELVNSKTYPYPAKLPSFLAYLGLLQLQKWPSVASKRKEDLERFINWAKIHNMEKWLPEAYFREETNIIPLRIVWSHPDGESIRKKIGNLIDIGQIWFLSPIISSNTKLDKFGYLPGSCTIAEKACRGIINFPISFSDSSAELFTRRLVSDGDAGKYNE